MAKILKIKIKRIPFSDHTHYEYPKEYDSSKIQILCYESSGEPENVINRDKTENSYEYCIGVVSDVNAADFLNSVDIVEINHNTACIDGRKWRPRIEKITDHEKIILILAKIARNETLKQNEKDAIDPDNAELGVSKSKLFDDLLTEHTQL